MDLTALGPVVDLCREHKKPFAFVLNAVHPQRRLTKTAPGIIRRYGPLCETMIADRKAYVAAMTVGKGASEVERQAGCRRARRLMDRARGYDATGGLRREGQAMSDLDRFSGSVGFAMEQPDGCTPVFFDQ